MAINPSTPTYGTADLLRNAAVQDVDVSHDGPNGQTSAKALVTASASSPSGDTTVHGPDATGSPPTADPVFVAGIDTNGDIAPIKTVAGHIQSISEQLQGQPVSAYGTVIVGMDPGASALPFLVDANGNLYTIPLTCNFWLETATPLAGSATFNGAARDGGAASPGPVAGSYFNGFFLADQTGTASIECSDDGATWATIASDALAVATPLILQVPVVARHYRVVLVNGPTPQASVTVRSSYTAA